MKRNSILIALLCIAPLLHAQTQLSVSDLNSLYTTTNGSWVSIHDPSVVYRDGSFYIWGSHLGCASSSDLVTFNSISETSGTFRKLTNQGDDNSTACTHSSAFNTQQVTRVKNYKGEEVDMPNFDAQAYCSRYASNKNTWIDGVMWAPDIIWNENMQKWCMYLSLDGDNWCSIIILLTSDSPTSGFVYQAPIVMGGFYATSFNRTSAPTYADTDMCIALDENISATPSRYLYDTSDPGKYWPNCIDPCAFFDEDGELWLTYGSWSGGIFMLKLDKETGLRDYTYTYESDFDSKKASGTSDPYFGMKIAGGYYVSGEGSYIQHIGDYYYLFVSYGGIDPDGGYDMRVFRSESPNGPFRDSTGSSATYTSWQLNYGPGAGTSKGMHLMGAYNDWGGVQTIGECSQGHNSVCQDDEGHTFIVYHTKFNDGTVGHQVRVHQLFLNENGWPVVAPFIYQGEETTDESIATSQAWTLDELVGDYQVLRHPYMLDHDNFEEMTPVTINLDAEGNVTGEMTGTWGITEGTGYIWLKIGNATYNGVLCEQSINGTTTRNNIIETSLKAIAFTTTTSSGVPLWGYKLEPPYAVAWNYKNCNISIREGQTISGNVSLLADTDNNTTLTWTSSDPDVIDETGKYSPREEDTEMTLTARLQCGDYYWEQTYNVTAQKDIVPSGDYLTGLVAYYNFDEDPTYNQYKPSTETDYDKATYSKAGSGTKPSLETDYARIGQVAHVEYGASGSNSYVRIPNPLVNYADEVDGFTVSAWIKRADNDARNSLWGFYGSTSTTATSGERLYLTGNAYIGYTNGSDTSFDINYPSTVYSDIPVGEWERVTVTVGPTYGVRIYVNSANKSIHSISASNDATNVKDLPISDVVSGVASLRYFYLGACALFDGSACGSADFCVDDLMIYNRELTANDVNALYTMSTRTTDFTIGENGTAVEQIASSPEGSNIGGKYADGIYDISGRRISQPTKSGIYIQNGKKVLVK